MDRRLWRKAATTAAAVVMTAALAGEARAQQPAQGQQPAAQGQQPAGQAAGQTSGQASGQTQGQPQGQQAAGQTPPARVFASDAGLVLNFIKPDKTADFEMIVSKLKEALQKSDKPERKQQAASWKVFRALEAGANGTVLYVFEIDPAVGGADYTVSTILAEGFPDQVQELFQKYADAYASGQNVVNLKLVSALGQ